MAFNISFFKTPKHRVFHYEPRYYDERKEHREMVKREALKEKALREGKELKEDEEYHPGQYISGTLREQLNQNRRHATSESVLRIIGMVSILIFFAFLIFFAKYFTLFLETLR